MKSFRVKLVLNFMVVAFGSFLLVYFLFNAIVQNYIREEALRELTANTPDLIAMTPPTVITPNPSPHFLESENIMQIRMMNHSIITTSAIVINMNQQILSPSLQQLNPDEIQEVLFLATYYVGNLQEIVSEELVIIESDNHTYYLKVIHISTPLGDSYSVLVYTDISYIMAFVRQMNQILGLLLAVSGLLSLSISLLMSLRFKQAITKLGSRALAIGQGNYKTIPEMWKYSEFESLSQSMDEMSDMLQTYERNQKQFFQNVSHELRTPLMSIQGYAEGIMSEVFPSEIASDIILNESKKMTELISQLLYISRLDNGIETKIAPLNLAPILQNFQKHFNPIAHQLGKTINLELLSDDMFFELDESKLETILTNILTNAIRHANKEIKIRATVDDKLVIVIENDGSQIPDKDLPYLFDRFFKGENGNTGLGLAICETLARQLKGKILVENLEVGVRFTVTF